jgi:hypothetical protein
METILGLFEQGLYGSVWLPQPLDAEESRGNGEAVLGPMIDLGQQHLPLCNKLRQPVIGGF